MKTVLIAALVLAGLATAHALPVTYVIDPSASSLTVSGLLDSTAHTEQASGSLTASYSGTLSADLDAGLLTFFGGSSMVAASQPVGTFAPAAVFRTNDNYGVLVGPGIPIALGNIAFDLAAGTVTNGGVPSGMIVFLTGGAIDVEGDGGVVGGGLAAPNTTASAASLTTVGTIETLVLPILMVNQLDTNLTLNFGGTITARRDTCGNGMLDPNEVCDDGNRDNGDCCDSTCMVADPFCGFNLDHYKCYEAPLRHGAAFAAPTVSLVDFFGTTSARVSKPTTLCNPVDKSGSGILDATAHLTCFPAKDNPRRRITPRSVLIRNQFGEQAVEVTRPGDLCVPSELNGVASALNIDHFRCYKARVPPKSSGPDPQDVTLADQFETRTARTVSFFEFCYPVSKNGEAIKDAKSHLTCYRLEDTSGLLPFHRFDASVSNQFGTQPLTVRPLALLCVPTIKLSP